jgi:hypothetical protein
MILLFIIVVLSAGTPCWVLGHWMGYRAGVSDAKAWRQNYKTRYGDWG